MQVYVELSSEGKFVQFHHFCYICCAFSILDYLLFVFLFIELDYYFTMSKDRVKVLGSPATWVEDFPINHGK